MPPICRLCSQPPREGDNLVFVTVLPGQPHWDALASNESPGQTNITVPGCYDCRRAYSIDYYGLPPEMIGDRPAWPKSRECRFCRQPFRQGERSTTARILPGDPQWAELSAGEPPDQTSVTAEICAECRPAFLTQYMARPDAPTWPGRHLI